MLSTLLAPNKRLLQLTLIVAGLSANAMATSVFSGLQVQTTWKYPDLNTTYQDLGSATVGSSIEYAATNSSPEIDFSNTNNTFSITGNNTTPFTFLAFNQGDFNGFVFHVVNAPSPIAGVSVVGATGGWSSFGSERLSFDASNIYVNMAGLTTDPNNQVTVGYTTAPEPGTFGLLSASLLALGFVRRRRTLASK